MEKDEFAEQLRASINHATLAHSNHPKRPEGAIRFWDSLTPYAIHPIWCAMTLLTETRLPEEIRLPGYVRRTSVWAGGNRLADAPGTTWPHPQGWQLNREKRLRLLASRRSGARIERYGQHIVNR
jgi:hypothetical protein